VELYTIGEVARNGAPPRLLMKVNERSTRAQPMGKVTQMKHLLAGVAMAALLGLAPTAMAQQTYSGGAPTQATPGAPAGAIQGNAGGGKEAIKNTREATSPKGATVTDRAQTRLNTSDSRSAPDKGPAEGSKGIGSAGGMHGSVSGGASGASAAGDMNKNARKGASGSSMSDRRGTGDMTTQELNRQELSRLRSAGG
jgi:hypothetical protein